MGGMAASRMAASPPVPPSPGHVTSAEPPRPNGRNSSPPSWCATAISFGQRYSSGEVRKLPLSDREAVFSGLRVQAAVNHHYTLYSTARQTSRCQSTSHARTHPSQLDGSALSIPIVAQNCADQASRCAVSTKPLIMRNPSACAHADVQTISHLTYMWRKCTP